MDVSSGVGSGPNRRLPVDKSDGGAAGCNEQAVAEEDEDVLQLTSLHEAGLIDAFTQEANPQ